MREGAFIVSAVLVGAIVGSLFAGQAADALGPRKALLLNNAWLLVGSILCAAAPGGYAGLLAGVLLMGYSQLVFFDRHLLEQACPASCLQCHLIM